MSDHGHSLNSHFNEVAEPKQKLLFFCCCFFCKPGGLFFYGCFNIKLLYKKKDLGWGPHNIFFNSLIKLVLLLCFILKLNTQKTTFNSISSAPGPFRLYQLERGYVKHSCWLKLHANSPLCKTFNKRTDQWCSMSSRWQPCPYIVWQDIRWQ